MDSNTKDQAYEYLKRLFDIVGSIGLILIFSPVMVATAVAIKLTSPGPVLADIPKRVGKGGKLFRAYKFRSMVVNAHTLLHSDTKYKKLLDEYKKGSFKSPPNDPRITKVGRFIRKYSIDETPQFINVLKGEMSIIGPRPCYQDELAEQQTRYPKTKEYIRDMLTVKPGITGFWQVSGRSKVLNDERLAMDAYYARKKSLLLDLLIFLKTPWAMLSGKDAV